MLLGDADVEDPVRERLLEGVEPDRLEHGCGDAHDVGALLRDGQHLVGEDRDPGRSGRRHRQPGLRVDDADAVELVGLVVLGGRVAAPLRVSACTMTGPPNSRAWRSACSTATTSWPSIGPTYFRPRSSNIPCGATMSFRPFFTPCKRVVDGSPRRACDRACAPSPESARSRGRAQRREVVGEPADGGRVGAPVVVDHDDERAVLGGGDVVQRLPGHAAGERAVSDDRDDRPVTIAGQLERLGEPVGLGQRGGGVAVLDPVVLGLGATGSPTDRPACAGWRTRGPPVSILCT